MSVVVIAFVRPQADKVEEVRKALLVAGPEVHTEPGCELYTLHEGAEEFIFVEKWESKEALRAHGTGAPLASMRAAIEDLLREPLEVHFAAPLEVGDSGKGALK